MSGATVPARPSWGRANRYWLGLLPVALVAMLAGSAYHVRTFYYEDDLHHRVAQARPGQAVDVTIPYTDTSGPTAYRFRVRLAGLTRVDRVTDSDTGETVAVPQGADAYRVHLDFRASPSQALRGCQLSVVGDDGERYDADQLGQVYRCVPPDRTGPGAATARGLVRGRLGPGDRARPPSWSTDPFVLVRHGTRVRSVLIWFTYPDYAELEVG